MIKKTMIALACWASLAAVQAQTYPAPNRPIKMTTMSSAGSAGDIIARVLAENIGKIIQGVIYVENKAGASGMIATTALAKSAPDGYTIGMGGAATHVILPAIHPKLPYNAIKDFEYIGQVATAPGILAASLDFPANNLKEFEEYAKKHPGVQYASWGIGTTGHFCGELLNIKKNLKIEHIPYKSISQIQTDLLGGHLKLAMMDGGSAKSLLESGKAKMIGTCTDKHPLLPNVRSFKDEGIFTDDKNIGQFRFTLLTPAGVPKEIVQKLESALEQTLKLPQVQQKILDLGLEPQFLSGQQVKAMTQNEIKAWAQVANQAHIKLD